MHFLRVNVTFYDAVNMIHNVIRAANQFSYTAKLMLPDLEMINSTNQTLKDN